MVDRNASEPETLSVHVSKFIRAPRERVFEAWISPELRRKWWLTNRPEGLHFCEIDARVGGRYCMKQIGCGGETPPGIADDYEWVMQGEFLEVSPPERLAFTWDVNHPNEPVSDERVTIEFREVDDGTEVTISHVGILSTQLRDGTEQGWSTHLGGLADFLERE